MFKPNRIFSTQNLKTGILEWYFQAREGYIGPYETKAQTETMLKEFIETCIAVGHTYRGQEFIALPAELQVPNFFLETKQNLTLHRF